MAKRNASERLPMPDVSLPERNFAVRLVANILIPLVRLSFKIRLKGAENLPKSGSYILAGNHCTVNTPPNKFNFRTIIRRCFEVTVYLRFN